MALDELEQRGVTRLPRPVDPATDLHAPNQAGGRVAGTNHGQTDRPLPPAVSPISGAGRVHAAACESNSLAGPGDPRAADPKAPDAAAALRDDGGPLGTGRTGVPRGDGRYSYRSASTGSRRAARIAG